MKAFTKSSLLLFLIIATFSIPSNAVINYKPDVEKKTTIIKKQKKAKKRGLFKRWKEQLVLMKLKKQHKKVKDKTIKKRANRSLFFGVVSLIFWALAYLSLVIASDSLLVALLILIFLSALMGSIFSISTLRKTKESNVQNKKERRKAIWGLAISLISGLPVLVILPFVIFLLS